MEGSDSTVVYIYVHTRGIALRGIPPPSSDTFIVISYDTINLLAAKLGSKTINPTMHNAHLFSISNYHFDSGEFFRVTAVRLHDRSQRVF
jgi:hypothetical protein